MQQNNYSGRDVRDILKQMQSEILRIGWLGVAKKYHPDVNPDKPLTEEKFKVYRAIYEHMKDKHIV